MTIERTYNEKYIESLTNLFNNLKGKEVEIYCNEDVDNIEYTEIIEVDNNFLKTQIDSDYFYTFLGDIIGFKVTGDDK